MFDAVKRFNKITANHKMNIIYCSSDFKYLHAEYTNEHNDFKSEVFIANNTITITGNGCNYVFTNIDKENLPKDEDEFAKHCVAQDLYSNIYDFKEAVTKRSMLKYIVETIKDEHFKESLLEDLEDFFKYEQSKDECFEFLESYDFPYNDILFQFPVHIKTGDIHYQFTYAYLTIKTVLEKIYGAK